MVGLGQIAFCCEGGIDTCTAAQNTLAFLFDLGPKVGSVNGNLKTHSSRLILESKLRDSPAASYDPDHPRISNGRAVEAPSFPHRRRACDRTGWRLCGL